MSSIFDAIRGFITAKAKALESLVHPDVVAAFTEVHNATVTLIEELDQRVATLEAAGKTIVKDTAKGILPVVEDVINAETGNNPVVKKVESAVNTEVEKL